jgi:AbrB family looped-hinge helix DNA binding protein
MKRESAVLSSRGQLTLPASVRKSVDIKQGDVLNVYEVDEKFIIIEKARATPIEEIFARFEESAKKINLKPEDVAEAIRDVRRDTYKKIYGTRS